VRVDKCQRHQRHFRCTPSTTCLIHQSIRHARVYSIRQSVKPAFYPSINQLIIRLKYQNQWRCKMNMRSQMQAGKNWIYANRIFWDSHWLENWKNQLCLSIGPNGGGAGCALYLYWFQCGFGSSFLPKRGSGFRSREQNPNQCRSMRIRILVRLCGHKKLNFDMKK